MFRLIETSSRECSMPIECQPSRPAGLRTSACTSSVGRHCPPETTVGWSGAQRKARIGVASFIVLSGDAAQLVIR
jgi:hypothetical protein